MLGQILPPRPLKKSYASFLDLADLSRTLEEAMPPLNTGEAKVLVIYLALCFKATFLALRDSLIAKVCAWFLSNLGLYGCYIPSWIVFILCHLGLFLFRQSSWRKVAVTLRGLISRDAADDELITQFFIDASDLVCYVLMSLVFRNIGTVWSFCVRVVWVVIPVLEFISGACIVLFCLVDNPRETFNIEAAKAWNFAAPKIAKLWDFAARKGLCCLQKLWQLFVATARLCVRCYIKCRGSLIAYRDRRTAIIATTLEKYKYSALEQGEIRLLKLSKWTPVSPIRCELVHVRLHEAPAFETISYTWGTQRSFKKLILNGRYFDVSERVYEIVHDRASSLMTRFIWIDSICDDDEKSSQVQLMRDIYGSSYHTVVWLGHAPDANEAMGFLAHLNRRMHFDDPNRRASLPLNKLNIDSPAWPALINLIKHDYWLRCWIIQEIAVSKKVIVSYGGEIITWDYFSSIMQALFHNDPNSVWHISKIIRRTTDLIPPPIDAGLRIVTLGQIRDAIQRDRSIKLFDVLIAGLNSRATDPRDNIFALQGISAAAESGDINPDYNSALERPFLTTAEYLLRQEYPSRILHLAGIGFYRNRKLQTSWVPDWSSPRLSRIYWRYPTESPYRSSGAIDDEPNLLLGPEGLTLIVRCIRVDHIQKLGPRFFGLSENGVPKTSSLPGDFPNLVETRSIALNSARSEPYPSGIPLTEAFWRTLIGDRTPTGTRPAQATFFVFYQALERFMNTMSKYELYVNPQNLNMSPEDQERLAISMSRDALDSGRFSNLAGPHTRERRFAITERGYMGMVPPYSKTGDEVFIIPGAQVPFLLRRRRRTDASSGEKWELVGESYFHGMMDGEMVNEGCAEQQLEIY
ncbi:putative heterokaryon incompatibility protein [Hyaloscypha variabilis F]|uniref:Putative heterokaryon incompatibility protein n=1 Tax=Hyaloscypha variabilis (strain UAMH 11265 / GT02V1 / F) TaxID=1149755 RepID=A0A2J6S243_HYAVF|nr:putative heterokaryon incompatibility protein [Hyaloscypha variabilis F]